jgi:hypothetical protein
MCDWRKGIPASLSPIKERSSDSTSQPLEVNMSDRTSEVFEAAASTLVATYSTGISKTTDGYLCESYDRILVYLSVSAVTSAGIVDVKILYSPDGTDYYTLTEWLSATTNSGRTYRLSATGDYALTFPAAGKFFKVNVAYVSGTSLVIDVAGIEAKS